jgi:hypothetical protein
MKGHKISEQTSGLIIGIFMAPFISAALILTLIIIGWSLPHSLFAGLVVGPVLGISYVWFWPRRNRG